MKVIALGEVLLRFSTINHLCLSQSRTLDSQFGGSELNVLGNLSHFGYETAIVTKIPDNTIGEVCKKFISTYNISTEFVKMAGERLGLYFYERGFSIRPNRIIYDRKYSAFSESLITDYDWDEIFKGASWFHVSGITPALSQDCLQITLDAMRIAKKKGLGVSLDLNYRENLWTSFAEARQVLSKLAMHADVCLGIEPLSLLGEDGNDWKDEVGLQRPYKDKELLLRVLKKLKEIYGLSKIAFTQRQLDNNQYYLKGFLYTDAGLFETPETITQTLDRVGTGDAFTAGILHGILSNVTDEKILEMAMTSFVYKHTIDGDINLLTDCQLNQLLEDTHQEIYR